MNAKRTKPVGESHTWEFKARFRRHAFGWKSQPAITRIKQVVTEIKKVAKTDARLAAEGAVSFLERVSPALERVDSSSGSIGTAVNNAIAELVPIIASAPVDATTRDAWLERLFDAYQDDIMTGGGNDIMFSGGCNTAEVCERSVAMIQAGLDTLWTEMAADGVKDVIYIQYSADAGTSPQSARPTTTKPVPICLTGKIYCHALPTTDLVMGQLLDGIHPTSGANDRIAKALVEMMEARKMRR